MNDMINNLLMLCDAPAIGSVDTAARLAKEKLSAFCPVHSLSGKSFYGYLDKGALHTVLIEAHIDEVGFVVTNVDENGFLTVSNCGGIDLRLLPATKVTVHAARSLPGVFISVPPHLSKGDEALSDICECKIDTGLGKEASSLIRPGDYVTFDAAAVCLGDGVVTGKALDDRACCAVLLDVAKRLCAVDCPVNVVLLMSDAEELGMRGAKTAAFALDFDEAVALDVSFADAPGVDSEHCGRLGDGVMIGHSPILDRAVTDRLCEKAKQNDIAHQHEIMNGSTGTDADVISLTKTGVPCGLLSVPLRNMHTPAETVDSRDMQSISDLLVAYLLAGGVK